MPGITDVFTKCRGVTFDLHYESDPGKELPFIVMVDQGGTLESLADLLNKGLPGVTFGSRMGSIWTAQVTYDGLKSMEQDKRIISASPSRPSYTLD